MIDWLRLIRAILGVREPEPTLRDFRTVDDLKAWFALHDELMLPEFNLCDDYSRESRALAEADGYFLSNALVYKGMLYGTVIFPLPGTVSFPDESVYHIANMAIVEEDQSCWYVDLNWNKLVKLCNFKIGGKW